jgi:nucleoside recognition membrane protein YjiH
MINKNEGLKLVVNALIKSVGSIFNVVFVGFIILMVFAITGINFFAGTFYHCSIDFDVIKDKFDCVNNGGDWINSTANFDNFYNAMQTLF